MKEAAGDSEHSRAIWDRFADRTRIIVAGQSSKSYIDSYQFGASGFFTGTGNIVPSYSIKIFNLIQEGKIEEAEKLVEKHEMNFLNVAKPMGWHASLKAAISELGLMDICERPPMVPQTESQREQLRVAMKASELI